MQSLLQALRDPEQAPAAIRALTTRAHTRLREIIMSMMRRSFPLMQRHHEADSILSRTWPKLEQALTKLQPNTPTDFFRLATFKVRQVGL
jgi:hypothetical protein